MSVAAASASTKPETPDTERLSWRVAHPDKFACAGQPPNARHPLRGIGLEASRSRQRRGRAGALAFPFVVFAQARLVLLQLRLQFGESLLATDADVFAHACGVERPG